ncbi:MAG: manganese efflux pump MntP family protein [Lachnospiraceae bacterium]|nr:manganese efflux pump MntP family protein [Lachnospiraceae bacterium]
MNIGIVFVINAVLFGVGLAMDAFSVSMANGLNEPHMKKEKMCAIAGTFCGFQIAMPLIGWFLVHTIVEVFTKAQKFIPVIALVLLLYIGGKMILEAIKNKDALGEKPAVKKSELFVQGIATSIDALSVGFTIAEYSWVQAGIEALIIGFVTFWICIGGLFIGRKFGTKLAGKASVLGGVILIAIGVEIFVSGML